MILFILPIIGIPFIIVSLFLMGTIEFTVSVFGVRTHRSCIRGFKAGILGLVGAVLCLFYMTLMPSDFAQSVGLFMVNVFSVYLISYIDTLIIIDTFLMVRRNKHGVNEIIME